MATTGLDAARSGFAVLVTLGRNNPGFTLEVDFGPSGADHLGPPQPRQQRDFKGSGGDAPSLDAAISVLISKLCKKRASSNSISFKIEHLSTAKSCSRILVIFTEGRFLGPRIRADSENEERRTFGIGGVGRASFDEEFGGTLG